MPFFKQGALHMSAKEVTDVHALDEKGTMQVLDLRLTLLHI